MPLPTWMRLALYATALMNALGAVTLSPYGASLRAIGGLPEPGEPLYMTIVATFVLIFGVAYLWVAVNGRADRQFIAVAAAGKLAYFGTLTAFWLAAGLPAKAPLGASGDLVFAGLFLAWLWTVRRS